MNPAAPNLDDELRRFAYKVDAGAEFVVTRPVFDFPAFESFLKRIESARLPIIAGVFPFENARHAEFMANEVPGVRVPEDLLKRMHQAGGRRGRGGRRRGDCTVSREAATRDCAGHPGVNRLRQRRSRPGSHRWTSMTDQI